jgi:Tol biopolymer transport system component
LLVAATGWAALLAGAVSGAEAPSIVANPTWSPDGREVAFAYTTSSTYRIVAAPVSGKGPIRTVLSAKNTNGCCDPMLWSPAGRILFDSNFTLISVPANGDKPIRLARDISWFILSPNGETAAYDGPGGHSPSGIGIVNVRGGKPVPVPRPARAADSVDGFSPDGTDLVFDRVPTLDGGPVAATRMVEHLSGGAPAPLSRTGMIGASHLPADAVQPQWSPNGRWIAFVHLGKLEVVKTVGARSPHVLAGWVVGGFSWSPNSKLLACFCGQNREHVRFTTIAPADARRTVLWANRSLHYLSEDSEDRPQWSRDSAKLVFLARVGPGYPPIQVWVVDADGTGLNRIA